MPKKKEPHDINGTMLNKDRHWDKISSPYGLLNDYDKRRCIALLGVVEDGRTETSVVERKQKYLREQKTGACKSKR